MLYIHKHICIHALSYRHMCVKDINRKYISTLTRQMYVWNYLIYISQIAFIQVISPVQFSCWIVSDFATPWTVARQASLSITNSWNLLKLMSIKPVMLSNHLILCRHLLLLLQSFPASGYFPMSQFFPSDGQSIGVSTSASDLPMNMQDWFPLGWAGWISLQFKGLSRVFSNTTVQNISSLALRFLYTPTTLTSVHD